MQGAARYRPDRGPRTGRPKTDPRSSILGLGYPCRVRIDSRLTLLVILCAAGSACTRPVPRFSLENARAHVGMLAGTIGSRPIGTPENLRARQYVIDQLRLFGFDVRVQETDARRLDLGLTDHVPNQS